MIILLVSGLEEGNRSIEAAERELLFIVHTMSDIQSDIATSTRLLLTTGAFQIFSKFWFYFILKEYFLRCL